MGASTTELGLRITSMATGTEEVQKLSAEMSRLIGLLGDTAKKSNELGNSHTSFDGFADKIKSAIQNPLQAAGEAAKYALTALGPIGTYVSAGAGMFGAFATAGFMAAKSLGQYADSVEDAAVRTGLSTKEVGQFGFAMTRVGGDIGQIEGLMRKLSVTVAENPSKIKELGVSLRDVNGAIRPSSDLLLDLSSKLKNMPNTFERNAAAVDIFGRGALEALPKFLELAEGVDRARSMGLGKSEAEITNLKQYQIQVNELEMAWSRLALKFKQPLAATVQFLFLGSGGSPLNIDDLSKMGLSAGAYTPKGQSQNDAAAASFFGYKTQSSKQSDAAMLAGLLAQEDTQAAKFRITAGQKSSQALLGQTDEGRKLKLSSLQDAEKTAREAYFGYQGTDEKKAGELKSTYDGARVAADSFKRSVDAITEAQKKAKEEAEKLKKGYEEIDKLLGKFWTDQVYDYAKPAVRKEIADQRATALEEQFNYLNLDRNLKQMSTGGKPWENDLLPWEQTAKTQSLGLFMSGTNQTQDDAQKRGLDYFRLESAHRERMFELTAGPNGEYAVAARSYDARLANAQKEYEITNNLYDLEKSRMEAGFAYQERLGEIEKSRAQNFRSQITSGFQSLISGGASAGPALLKSFGVGTASQMLGNFAEDLYPKVAGKLSIPGMSSDSWAGKMFAGTAFGAKDAIEQRHTSAMDRHAAALEGATSGGGGGIAGAAVGLFKGRGLVDSTTADWINYGWGGPAPAGFDGRNPTQVDAWGSDVSPDVTAGSGYGASRLPGIGKSVGYGAAIAGAGFGAYSGIHAGGAQGALTATGSLTAATGAIMGLAGVSGPAAPILAGVGMALGLVSMLLGDPKKNRATDLQNEATSRQRTDPTGVDYLSAANGGSVDYNYRGDLRTQPVVINYNIPINALDAPSFVDYLKSKPGELAAGITHAINSGNADDVIGTLQQVM